MAITPVYSQKVFFLDDFKDNTNKWALWNEQFYVIRIEEGLLKIINSSNSPIQSVVQVPEVSEPYGIEARMLLAKFADATSSYSLRFGMDNTNKNYISYSVNNQGQFKISVFRADKDEKELSKWTYTDNIRTNDWNCLTVEKEGTKCIFRINGKQVFTYDLKKFWFGNFVSIKAPSNSTLFCDGVTLYKYTDLTTGEREQFSPLLHKQNNEASFKIAFPEYAYKQENTKPIVNLSENKANTEPSSEFKEFMINYSQLSFPYKFDYEKSQGREITNLPFVTRQASAGGTRFAIGKITECNGGYVLLTLYKNTRSGSDNSNFSIEKYDKSGKWLGSKIIAQTQLVNGSPTQIGNFNIIKEGNVFTIQTQTKYQNGNVNKEETVVRGDYCTL
jgi:hypothetical protein